MPVVNNTKNPIVVVVNNGTNNSNSIGDIETGTVTTTNQSRNANVIIDDFDIERDSMVTRKEQTEEDITL